MELNEQIRSVAASLSRMAESDGELWEYEAISRSIASIAEQKRASLLSGNPALSLIEKLFGEHNRTRRAKLAEELRCEALRQLHDIRWTVVADSDKDLDRFRSVGENLALTYSLLTTCAIEEEPSEESSETNSDEYFVMPEGEYCLYFSALDYDHDFLIEQLVQAGLAGKEDAEQINDILEEMTLPYEQDVLPNWKGSLRALATLVVLGNEIGLFRVERKIKTRRDKEKNEVKLNSPNYESAIRKTFLRNHKAIYVGISREYIEPIRKALNSFVEYARIQLPQGSEGEGFDLADALSVTNTNSNEIEHYLDHAFPILDIQVMQILDRVLKKRKKDQV